MATASLVMGGTQRKSKVRVGPLVERVLGWVILAGILIWFMANLVADPNRFLGSLLVGLQNGMLYALVALGYLVYGIMG
jgi:branched-chain amino acid transport system permease protein